MSTKYKLAGIALVTLAILLLRWAVAHTFQLALLFALVAVVAVVAGPAIAKGTSAVRKLGKREQPKQLPTTSTGDIDWSAIVLGTQLPNERKDV